MKAYVPSEKPEFESNWAKTKTKFIHENKDNANTVIRFQVSSNDKEGMDIVYKTLDPSFRRSMVKEGNSGFDHFRYYEFSVRGSRRVNQIASHFHKVIRSRPRLKSSGNIARFYFYQIIDED